PVIYPLSLHDALPISVGAREDPEIVICRGRSAAHVIARAAFVRVGRDAELAVRGPARVRDGAGVGAERAAGAVVHSVPERSGARSEEHTSELQSRSDL